MRILILGANSFVARSIEPLFDRTRYTIELTTRKELDLRNFDALRFKLRNGSYDFVINCAISGGGRLLKKDTLENFYENILMHENLISCHKYYGRLIDFASGAQYNRNEDIYFVREGQEMEPSPDFYALAKRVNSYRSKDCNAINLRIFNVFGPLEREDRFIKTCIRNCIENKDINIWGDKYFDFFYVKDLYKLIDVLITSGCHHNEINCVYKEKYKFSNVAHIIKRITNSNSKIRITQQGINKHYIGDGSILCKYIVPIGLEKGIEETYLCMKQEKK